MRKIQMEGEALISPNNCGWKEDGFLTTGSRKAITIAV